MAHHKSAVKRIRRNARANVNNSRYLSSVRTAVKRFRAAVASAKAGTGDQAQLPALLGAAQSLLAKAATKGVIHKNNASRKVGRLTLLLRTVGQEPVQAAEKKAPAAKKAAGAKKAPVKKTTAAKKAPAKKK